MEGVWNHFFGITGVWWWFKRGGGVRLEGEIESFLVLINNCDGICVKVRVLVIF